MKTLIVLMTLVSSFAFAEAVQAPKTVAQISGLNAQIAYVQLNESGLLTVVKTNRTVAAVKLSGANMQELLWSAQMLSEAELVTETREVVCMMMMPRFSFQNLSVLDAKTNALKLVLTTDSCAVTSYTHPKEDYVLDTAKILKAQLIVLAKQLVK